MAANRNTEPAILARFLRGEVDWIVMKALEKDRTRRYETANDLGRDLLRYLNDDPVEARPTSAAYRLRKLIRRNKGPALAASLLLLTLLTGIAGTTWGMWRADHHRQVAVGKEKEASNSAEVLKEKYAEPDEALTAATAARRAEAERAAELVIERGKLRAEQQNLKDEQVKLRDKDAKLSYEPGVERCVQPGRVAAGDGEPG